MSLLPYNITPKVESEFNINWETNYKICSEREGWTGKPMLDAAFLNYPASNIGVQFNHLCFAGPDDEYLGLDWRDVYCYPYRYDPDH